MLLSMGWSQIQPAFATELQAVPTESIETEPPDPVATETRETDPAIPTETVQPVPPEKQPSEPDEMPSEPSGADEAKKDGSAVEEETQPPVPEEKPSEPSEPTDPEETIVPQTEPLTEPSVPYEGEDSTAASEGLQTEVPEAIALEDAAEETQPETEPAPDAGAQDEDLGTVAGQGIRFRLFNYSTDINKAAGCTSWRPISSYFTFRNSRMEPGTDASAVNVPSPNMNSEHDEDGFTKRHATVERVLDGGYPVLDFTRNADGSARTNPGIGKTTRSLAYLFSAGDHAVTAYSPANTMLQQSGSHYWYNSAVNAVDYDVEANRFRLRSYPERNSTTAGYGSTYGDFLPFTYTGGITVDSTADGIPYQIDNEDTDYWFGMTMQVNFFQTKGGKLGTGNMVFRFSGDDDVWVFVDDVLVLDLGGTHGTVNGSINFATGEVRQYLSWGGANGSEAAKNNGSATSFPTSIRACFDAAGRVPNGGWSKDGRTFADFTEHTLKFFYLERGAAVANCSLDFRLPTLPDESLTVTKDLAADTETEVRDYIADSLYYNFRVMKADDAGNATPEPFLVSGMTYELLENGVKIGTGTVGDDNCFRLKAGQSAQFAQMLHKGNGSTRYVVEEIMPDDLTGQYAGVEYLISGAGGNTVTEDDPAESFTAFRTAVLSAEHTQTVTFRNRVDTAKLGTLKITKRAAPGTRIPPDLFFKMQVSVGEKLLPVGTSYTVGNEIRTVETAGILFLRAGETAIIEEGILSGSSYRVTELSSSLDGYRATYTGAVEPEGDVICTMDGAAGVFPLAATVHIMITNADYDFPLQIPIRKIVLDYQKDSDFMFLIEQVERSDDAWQVVKTLPEQVITITGPQPAETFATIGYRSDAEGTFYYRITEKPGAEGHLYDASTYIVEVAVSGGTAKITGIRRDDNSVDEICFVNRAVTTLTVTKTVAGVSSARKFPFTVEISLNDEPFILPEPDGKCGYTVSGNMLSFTLGHGESIRLPCIPIGAVVTVTETEFEGFLVLHQLEGTDETLISGASRELQFANSEQVLHFYNQSGYRLPNTGGAGSILYTAGGVSLSLSAGAAALYKRRSRGRRKQYSPDA